mmetsp:Transcript_46209/g.73447  ORF Transcript_46209/g.73447 Transcript_46209/m.73447 type:complete len:231 (-) Transcript_46209:336-1028(-)
MVLGCLLAALAGFLLRELVMHSLELLILLVKALQHLTQGLARHHWLFSSGAATRSPRTFHGAPGCHLTFGSARCNERSADHLSAHILYLLSDTKAAVATVAGAVTAGHGQPVGCGDLTSGVSLQRNGNPVVLGKGAAGEAVLHVLKGCLEHIFQALRLSEEILLGAFQVVFKVTAQVAHHLLIVLLHLLHAQIVFSTFFHQRGFQTGDFAFQFFAAFSFDLHSLQHLMHC